MGHPLTKRSTVRRARVYKRLVSNGWQPKETRLSLAPLRVVPGSGWEVVKSVPECEAKPAEISEGYKSAIALLRSLRNVSEDEAQEKRESWELLSQALDEDRYH